MQILDWENKTGVHCGSVAIQNVINYYGVDYPEEMCFGLGAGLGFFIINYLNLSPQRSSIFVLQIWSLIFSPKIINIING